MSEHGGYTPEALVTEEVKKICIKMRPIIEKKAGQPFKGYIPLTFRKQILAETDYYVKVYVDVDKCVHALIRQLLPNDVVDGVEYPKTASEPLIILVES